MFFTLNQKTINGELIKNITNAVWCNSVDHAMSLCSQHFNIQGPWRQHGKSMTCFIDREQVMYSLTVYGK